MRSGNAYTAARPVAGGGDVPGPAVVRRGEVGDEHGHAGGQGGQRGPLPDREVQRIELLDPRPSGGQLLVHPGGAQTDAGAVDPLHLLDGDLAEGVGPAERRLVPGDGGCPSPQVLAPVLGRGRRREASLGDDVREGVGQPLVVRRNASRSWR